MFYIIEGSGHSVINKEEYPREMGDTFCVPAWHKYQHCANSCETVYLYRWNDLPVLKSLDLYSVAGVDTESLVSE